MFLAIINKLKLLASEYCYTSSDIIKQDISNSVGYVGILYNNTGMIVNKNYLLEIKPLMENLKDKNLMRKYMIDDYIVYCKYMKNK